MMVDRIYRLISDKQWLTDAYETLEGRDTILDAGAPDAHRYGSSHRTVDEFLVTSGKRLRNRSLFDKVTPPNGCTNWVSTSSPKPNPDGTSTRATTAGARISVRWICQPVHVRSELRPFRAGADRTEEMREWIAKAELRRARILEYCYDPEAKQFYDYDYVNGRRSDVLSGAVFALLYSGAVPREYAGHIVQALLRLEFPYGIAACEDKPYDYPYQWSYPNTWPRSASIR